MKFSECLDVFFFRPGVICLLFHLELRFPFSSVTTNAMTVLTRGISRVLENFDFSIKSLNVAFGIRPL